MFVFKNPKVRNQKSKILHENLSGFVNNLAETETPLRDRIPRKTGSGLAASWNIITAIGSGNAPFAEGGTPNEDNTTYARRSAVYKELGKTKSITDKMLAASKSFTDIEALETEVAMREVIRDGNNRKSNNKYEKYQANIKRKAYRLCKISPPF